MVTITQGDTYLILVSFMILISILFIRFIYKKHLEYESTDPVKKCIVYKQFGCSHVDGMLCNYEKCNIRLNQELWELEQQLDIPLKDIHGFDYLKK